MFLELEKPELASSSLILPSVGESGADLLSFISSHQSFWLFLFPFTLALTYHPLFGKRKKLKLRVDLSQEIGLFPFLFFPCPSPQRHPDIGPEYHIFLFYKLWLGNLCCHFLTNSQQPPSVARILKFRDFHWRPRNLHWIKGKRSFLLKNEQTRNSFFFGCSLRNWFWQL